MTADKPLFVPLMRVHYEAFEAGMKEYEWRPEGPRWNTKTCWPGRRVILSCGYGTQRRLEGTIKSTLHLEREHHLVPATARQIYPDVQRFIAIRIEVDQS